ncbi:MAG: hypothetical protein M1119_10375 [Firmicutes bacterium]|nr:hypothetical protein [Bacillota bacterium]
MTIIQLRRRYQGKALYLTNRRHLNGMMHQQGAFSGVSPFYTPREYK